MKKLILSILLVVSSLFAMSQQDTLWRGMSATYYTDMYNDSTKGEKLMNFYLTFRKDSIIIFNEDRMERSYLILEVLTDTRKVEDQVVTFYSGRDYLKRIIIVTVVRNNGYLSHVAISNGTYLVIFHILKLEDGTP